jgi:Flp pilus assembly protein TadG
MLLARFWKSRRGAVARMVAITIVPLIGAVGAAVDYARQRRAHRLAALA